MDYYCPTCNTPLTKSLVGYLCHGCGSVHGFEKTRSNSLSSTSQTDNTLHSPAQSAFKKSPTQTTPVKKTIKHHVHGFIVPKIADIPELRGPLDTEHQISAPRNTLSQSNNSKNISFSESSNLASQTDVRNRSLPFSFASIITVIAVVVLIVLAVYAFFL